MYEETTGEQGIGGDSSCDDEEEQKEPPPEPTRFGWIQGVMVGRASIVVTTRRMCVFTLTTTGCIFSLLSCCTALTSPNFPNHKSVTCLFL